MRRAVAGYDALGLTPIVGPELEFFLCEPDPAAPGGLRRYVEHDQKRLAVKGPCEGDPLPLARRQAASALPGSTSQPMEIPT